MTFADQNLATFVWAVVRILLFAAPYFLISLNPLTQSLLCSDGGGSGRTWSALLRMNGCTLATHGVCGSANGGVRRHTPGACTSVEKDVLTLIGVMRPSPFRRLMIWFAAARPTAFPSSFAAPFGISVSASAYCPPSVVAWVGK